MDSTNSKKTFTILMLSIVILLIGLIVVGFVMFSLREKDVVEEEENGADIILNYSTNNSGLQIRNASKTKDEDGIINLKDGEYFDFSVEVILDNASNIEYEISVEKDEINSTIPDSDIKIYLEKEIEGTYTKVFEPNKFTPLKKKSELGSKKGSMVLTNVTKTKSSTDKYRLKMWLSDKATIDTGTYAVEVEVNGIAK
ncbi:MAG: hypothetical protein IK137_04445 [Bacilli bacterium]|nr:hypothetical protein [Bacilli bacterium]